MITYHLNLNPFLCVVLRWIQTGRTLCASCSSCSSSLWFPPLRRGGAEEEADEVRQLNGFLRPPHLTSPQAWVLHPLPRRACLAYHQTILQPASTVLNFGLMCVKKCSRVWEVWAVRISGNFMPFNLYFEVSQRTMKIVPLDAPY